MANRPTTINFSIQFREYADEMGNGVTSTLNWD